MSFWIPVNPTPADKVAFVIVRLLRTFASALVCAWIFLVCAIVLFCAIQQTHYVLAGVDGKYPWSAPYVWLMPIAPIAGAAAGAYAGWTGPGNLYRVACASSLQMRLMLAWSAVMIVLAHFFLFFTASAATGTRTVAKFALVWFGPIIVGTIVVGAIRLVGNQQQRASRSRRLG